MDAQENIRAALAYVPAHDRDMWLRMGMAVKSELGEDGADLWDEWSEQADSYNAAAAKAVWHSIKANGKVTIATLFHEAQRHGFRLQGSARPTPPTAEEMAERDRKAQAAALAKREKHDAAATKAVAVWKAGTPARADHPYLARKQVRPVSTLREMSIEELAEAIGYPPKQGDSEYLVGRVLLVPVQVADRMSTLEMIDQDGRKTALAGGRKSGGYWAAQPMPAGDGLGITLLIAEGVATALSAVAATGRYAFATLTKDNLRNVAEIMRQQYPRASIVVLGDLGNGECEALDAAQAVGGLLATPDFGADRPEGAKDFNDLAVHRGIDAVADCLRCVTLQTDVTPVTDVQPSNAADLGVTGSRSDAGTAVTALPEDIERPCFRNFAGCVPRADGGKYQPGVWFFGSKPGRDGDAPTLTQQWVSSPLHIEAVTSDGQDNNFGRLLRLKNTLGRWRDWAMPMELLRGAGDDLRGELLAMGVEIDPSAKNLLGRYLQSIAPKRRVRCALQVGWCGDSFVLPDTVIGPNATGVIFQSGERGHEEHTRAGTLAGWQAEIAARAVGNPLLLLALSASFAGPLLQRCNAEGGGLHFVGDSSTGKTTAIEAACATWGGANFRRSWRATANGMEGAAALFNDCLLALDEISECDPREVGLIVYALGNGRGKQRANRTGSARSVTRWRCFVLSSGERTIGTTMAEGGHRAKAGQAVRLLDIPAARRYGAWDELHGLASGTAFADAIKRAAITHYGHAGRSLLERLTRDPRDFCELLERIKALPEFSAEGGEGQDKRAAGRFALVALAGELATEYGITGWLEGAATAAAAQIFAAWRALRGRGNDERRQILERVSDFVDRHGDGRFSNAKGGTDTGIRDRAGWWRDDASGGRAYLFTKDGMREALKGFDFKRALDTLQASGALPPPDAGGERAKPQRIAGRVVRLYEINLDNLGADHGA